MKRLRWSIAILAVLLPGGQFFLTGMVSGSSSSWSGVASMPSPRSGLGAATGSDGRIYAVGGGNSRTHTSLKTVEGYDSATNRWTSAPSIGQGRFYLASTPGRDGRIYAVGGVGTGPVLQSVEAYTPSSAALPSAAHSTAVPRQSPTPTLKPAATPGVMPTVAPPVMEPTKTPIPIKASLAARSIRPGAQEMVVVQTLSGAQIMARIVYAVSGGFKTHGTANSSGRWQHRWKVNARHPGPALVRLLVLHGQDHRYYTLHFTVV